MKKIIFDDNVKLDILKAFGKTTDAYGFIIDKETKEKELDHNHQPILFDKFSGIFNYKGKPTFFESDVPSLIEVVHNIRN